MTSKARMALTGLALGVVVLSGCTNTSRQTYTGPVNNNRAPMTSGKQDWSNPPTARQQVPLGAQPMGNPQSGFPMTSQQPAGTPQYSCPLPSGAGQVQPAGVPAGASGQSFRQPAGVSSIPASSYPSTPANGTVDPANPHPYGQPLTSSPMPTLGSYPTPTVGPMPARTIPTTPCPQMPPGYPSATSENDVGAPLSPSQPLR